MAKPNILPPLTVQFAQKQRKNKDLLSNYAKVISKSSSLLYYQKSERFFEIHIISENVSDGLRFKFTGVLLGLQ